MLGHSIEPFVVGLALPAVSVLLGMAWYKLTSRRNRPFEPTLWLVFRWAFVIIVLIEVLLANVDNLISFHRSKPMLFAIGTASAILVVLTPAVIDWRLAARKERRQTEQRGNS
jgi:hypothetical protein